MLIKGYSVTLNIKNAPPVEEKREQQNSTGGTDTTLIFKQIESQ